MSAAGSVPLQRGRRWARPLFYLGNNRLSQAGVVVTTASGITLLTFYTTEFFGVRVGPYIGIITFLILPAVFILGLLLIPAGMWRRWRREKRAGRLPGEYPQINFGDPKLRETAYFVLVMTGVNLALFLTATYRGVHYMDSAQFCGLTCHGVMQPEYTAYQNSPHARVGCVECHVGPGAPSFVRSKIAGSYQVISVTLDLYPRPIPTPIKNLRPSRETCEQCHWALKFHGDKLVVKTQFDTDEENTETKTVLLMHTGGIDPLTGQPQGNHGVHLQPGTTIEYLSADEQRQEIPYVRYRKATGEVIEYVSDSEAPLDQYRAGSLRRMDCMDCHNRPTHTFQLPEAAVNQAMAAGRIDPALPNVKQQSLEVLQADYESQAQAAQEIRQRLLDYYRENYPDQFESEPEKVEQAAEALIDLYRRNVFPQMKVAWGTYPNHLGHQDFPGCFRCHDGLHESPGGEFAIPSDCDTCHALLAFEEPEPEILETLQGF